MVRVYSFYIAKGVAVNYRSDEIVTPELIKARLDNAYKTAEKKYGNKPTA